MIDNFFGKFKKLTLKDYINLSLWIISFVLLIIFVIISATMTHGSNATEAEKRDYANALAITGLLFSVSLVTALFTTATFSFLKSRNGH